MNTWSPISGEPSIEQILNEIRSGSHKTKIDELRLNLTAGNKEFYDNFKKQLPAVTFSGVFSAVRNSDHLKNYNPVIVIDIDKLEYDDLSPVYNALSNDIYVFSFWRSPSNLGFKGLVPISYSSDSNDIDLNIKHRSAFYKLADYFKESYNIILDKSGSDITRLCFLSYDEELIVKDSINSFYIDIEDIQKVRKESVNTDINKLKFTSSRDALYNPEQRNNSFNRKLMTDIIRYLTNKNLSITHEYENWSKVAMVISNNFTYDVGLKYFLKLSALDHDKFNEIACANFLLNCYETRKGIVNFGSLIYLANQKGYKTKYQKNGVGKTEA